MNGRRLGYWRFNATNWPGEEGQLPMQSTNNSAVASFSGTALLSDSATDYGGVLYHDVEQSGQVNFNFRCGTVRFWFMPNWTAGGSGGPGYYCDLLSCGSYSSPVTNGLFMIYMNPQGTNISVEWATNSGAANWPLYADTSNWVISNWYQFALTYTATNTAMYINGQLVSTGGGQALWPNATVRAQGVTVNSGYQFAWPSAGSMDELETFNYPLSASQILTDYQFVQGLPAGGGGASDPSLGLQVFTPLK